MALHILCLESDFPEVLEERPASGYVFTEIKPSGSSLLKRINILPGVPEKMAQEEVPDHPDYVPFGLKCQAALLRPVWLMAFKKIPFKEINRPQFCPDLNYPPPQPTFS